MFTKCWPLWVSLTSDLVTSQSSKYTVPISFFKLHVESDHDSRTWSGAQPKADCQSKLPFIFHSLGLCPLYFHMLYCFLFFYWKGCSLSYKLCSMFDWKCDIIQNLYFYFYFFWTHLRNNFLKRWKNRSLYFRWYCGSTLSTLVGVFSS